MMGLLATTAVAGHVTTGVTLFIVGVTGAACFMAVVSKQRLGDDRSRDALAIHALGGFAGTALAGVFARGSLNEAGPMRALFGNIHHLYVQLLACGVTGAYAVIAPEAGDAAIATDANGDAGGGSQASEGAETGS
jgi:Amt family ammonium transporter